MNHFWTWTRNGTPVVTTPAEVDIADEAVLRGKLRAASCQRQLSRAKGKLRVLLNETEVPGVARRDPS